MKETILEQVYRELYGPEINKANLEELGQRMAKAVGRETPWSYRSLKNTIEGYKGFNLSLEMKTALTIIATQLDGGSPLLALVKEVQAYSINGYVQPGSIVLGHSRRCDGCQALIVPKVPWQRFCCRDCREKARHSK